MFDKIHLWFLKVKLAIWQWRLEQANKEEARSLDDFVQACVERWALSQSDLDFPEWFRLDQENEAERVYEIWMAKFASDFTEEGDRINVQ